MRIMDLTIKDLEKYRVDHQNWMSIMDEQFNDFSTDLEEKARLLATGNNFEEESSDSESL